MWYETELMRSILQSDFAKEAVDMVSPIYGESYQGLWLFQVLGIPADKVKSFAQDLYENQIFVDTTTWLITYYEKEYGLIPDSSLTIEERRARIKRKKNAHYPMNPERMKQQLTAILGADVNIAEHVAKNTFQVSFANAPKEGAREKAIEYLEMAKPAHLIYNIIVRETQEQETNVYYKGFVTQGEKETITIKEVS